MIEKEIGKDTQRVFSSWLCRW